MVDLQEMMTNENSVEPPIRKSIKKNENKKIIGICGGVGPAAGVLLHQTILKHTDNGGTDQGHLDVCHLSRSSDVTDRTNYLLKTAGGAPFKGENPGVGMARTFDMLKHSAMSNGTSVVAGVPCNTFHAQPIWDEFIRSTRSNYDNKVEILHMLQETAKMIKQVSPNCKKVGLMSTTGTRNSRVYHDLLEPLGYEVVEVSKTMQEDLHETIYNKEWGIKGTSPIVHPKAIERFHHYAKVLADQGADVAIMGCTEIPFAFNNLSEIHGTILIDPLVALARAMIRQVDPNRLKPLTVQRNVTKKKSSRTLSELFSSLLSPSKKSQSATSTHKNKNLNHESDWETDSDTDSEIDNHGDNKNLFVKQTSKIFDFYNEYVEQMMH